MTWRGALRGQIMVLGYLQTGSNPRFEAFLAISTTRPRSSSTRGSCARTGISRTGCFYIEQVSPRIFVFDLQCCEVFFKLPTSIGVLYMLPRPLLIGLAWRSQRPVNGSCTSSDWVESQVRGHSWTSSTTAPCSEAKSTYPEAGSSAPFLQSRHFCIVIRS